MSNEFRITGGPKGSSPDAALHEPILKNVKGQTQSDLLAIEATMRLGVSLEQAVRLHASEPTKRLLRASGAEGI